MYRYFRTRHLFKKKCVKAMYFTHFFLFLNQNNFVFIVIIVQKVLKFHFLFAY